MPANDREVFEHLTSDPDTPTEIDHLTFAIFVNEKQEWIKLFEQRHGRQPNQAEADEWISNVTEWRFSQMRQEAIQFFDNAARRYLDEEIADGKEEVLRSALIREVKAAGSFWKQLAIALVTAILAPLIIGAVIAFALTYDRIAPSINAISGRLQPPIPTDQVEKPAAPK